MRFQLGCWVVFQAADDHSSTLRAPKVGSLINKPSAREPKGKHWHNLVPCYLAVVSVQSLKQWLLLKTPLCLDNKVDRSKVPVLFSLVCASQSSMKRWSICTKLNTRFWMILSLGLHLGIPNGNENQTEGLGVCGSRMLSSPAWTNLAICAADT